MPGFVLEEPFPLARFHNTVGENDIQFFTVGVNALESPSSTLLNDDDSVDHNYDVDSVAITVQGEGFKVYNTTDQKCINSWITPPGIAFVGPATHITGGRDTEAVDYTYAIVASGPDVTEDEEGKIIWLWKNTRKGDNQELEKITKTFDEKMCAIHTSTALPSHVIMVGENGSIDLATKDLDRLTAKQKVQQNSGKVIWSTVLVTSNAHTRPCCIPTSMVPSMSTIVVTISSHTNKNEEANHYVMKLNHVNVERRSIDILTTTDLKLTAKPIAFTLEPNDGRITILTADGTWTIYRLQLKHSSSKKISCSLSEHLSIPLKGYRFYDEHVGSTAALAPLSDSYVALVAPRTASTKKSSTANSNEVEHVVSVWDVKYGTLQAEQVVKMNEKHTFSKNPCVYNIAVLPNSHLAVTVSAVAKKPVNKSVKSSKKMVEATSAVMLCPYYSEPISLLAALGKMRQTVDFMGINQDLSSDENFGFWRSGKEAVSKEISLHNGIEDAGLVYDKWVAKVEKRQKMENDTLAKLMDSDISQEEFTSVFFDYVHFDRSEKDTEGDIEMKEIATSSADSIAVKTEEYRQKMNTFSKRSLKKKPEELSQFFLSNIVAKCFKTNTTTTEDKSKATKEFWPVDVILYLMARSSLRSSYADRGIINSILSRNDWAIVPLVLEKAHDIPENDLVTLLKALIALCHDKVNGAEWRSRFSIYMKMIVDAPRNDIFLQQSLKRITASELQLILETIVEWLKDRSSNLSKHANIVNFANAILDVQYPTIILEASLQATATTLRQLVASEIEVTDDLEQLRNILGAYDRKNKHLAAKQAIQQAQSREASVKKDAPMDELTKFRQKHKGKFGGEQGIPVYRVEVFRF
ncbi:hypothetical protein BDF20DRAFT_106790 [Mycotypha africana]|uniref:uncharacterized protein n=1 Tax=Mycotypha africana TaxID=64632 RepID=UPI002300EC4B|nr:uncharacterized protein BDF20DRAFT_106790 [Mycotypha africana]KAI8970156.1 hypothetical protein BDF20DRAFT_106790 [Mycotypha africana]